MMSKRNIYYMYPCLFPCSTSMKFRKSVVCHAAPSFGPWIGNNSNVLFNVTVFCSLLRVEGKWICKKNQKNQKNMKPTYVNPKILGSVPDLSYDIIWHLSKGSMFEITFQTGYFFFRFR